VGEDGTLRLWDSLNGDEKILLPTGDRLTCVKYSPWNNRICCGGEGGKLYILKLYGFDADTLKLAHEEDSTVDETKREVAESIRDQSPDVEEQKHPKTREAILNELDLVRHRLTRLLEDLDYPPSDLDGEERESWRKGQLKKIEELKAKEQRIWETLENLESGQILETSKEEMKSELQTIDKEKEEITSSESTTITCKCGHRNPVSEKWCKNCGREL
jgi:hypothetical protein